MSVDPVRTYYAELGVAEDADTDAIAGAWRALAKKHHPDLARDEGERKARTERSARLNAAKVELLDPVKRSNYDLELRRSREAAGMGRSSGSRSGATRPSGEGYAGSSRPRSSSPRSERTYTPPPRESTGRNAYSGQTHEPATSFNDPGLRRTKAKPARPSGSGGTWLTNRFGLYLQIVTAAMVASFAVGATSGDASSGTMPALGAALAVAVIQPILLRRMTGTPLRDALRAIYVFVRDLLSDVLK